MLFVISDYQKRKGVSLQFIAEYTQKGIFQKIELPIFAEYGGEKITVGTKTLLEVPVNYLPLDTEEIQEAENLAKQVSADAEIQAIFKKMLLQDDKQEQLRKRYDRIYTKNHPKHQLYQDAIFRFYDILEEQAKNLLNEAKSLQTFVESD